MKRIFWIRKKSKKDFALPFFIDEVIKIPVHYAIFYSDTGQVIDGIVSGATIELIGIVPPMETVQYFDDVRSAAVHKETLIQQAQESASTFVVSAQAEASAYTQGAITDQHERLAQVQDNIAEFNGLHDLYGINPQLIRAGIFRERMGAIIAQSGGSIIVPDGGQSPVIVLP